MFFFGVRAGTGIKNFDSWPRAWLQSFTLEMAQNRKIACRLVKNSKEMLKNYKKGQKRYSWSKMGSKSPDGGWIIKNRKKVPYIYFKKRFRICIINWFILNFSIGWPDRPAVRRSKLKSARPAAGWLAGPADSHHYFKQKISFD